MKYLILVKCTINVSVALWLAGNSRWALAMMFAGFSVADMGSMLAI